MEEKKNKNLIEVNSFVSIDNNGNKMINWDKIKLSFLLSSYKHIRAFLVKENILTKQQINSGWIKQQIIGWDLEKKDWEKQALEITMHNLRETKIVELQGFLKEEGAVVKQLLNMAKIAMNNLMTKTTDKKTGKATLHLQNTKGFKQISESTLNILKYSRDRLGVPFEKEAEGLNNAVNFNFDLVNLDEFDSDKLINLFKKKDAEQSNSKSIKGNIIKTIPEVAKN